MLSQRLDFTRGRLTFSGELSPELDFVAETRVGDLTAQIAVSGQASQPRRKGAALMQKLVPLTGTPNGPAATDR